MGYKLVVLISGVIFFSSVQPAPVSKEDAARPQDKTAKDEIQVTLNAYSKSNASYSTFEVIMEEIAARKAAERSEHESSSGHTINKRY